MPAVGDPEAAAHIFEGPNAVFDMWTWKFTHGAARTDDLMLPTLTPLMNPDFFTLLEHQKDTRPMQRILTRLSALDTVVSLGIDVQDVLTQVLDIRLVPTLPTWMSVMDSEYIALPSTYGEEWPGSVVLVRSIPHAQLGLQLFEQYWASGTPIVDALHA